MKKFIFNTYFGKFKNVPVGDGLFCENYHITILAIDLFSAEFILKRFLVKYIDYDYTLLNS